MFTWGPQSDGGGDPYFAQVALLLHCEGADGSLVLTDSSSHASHFALTGSQHEISTSQAKFGTSALRIKNASPTNAPVWTGSRFTAAAGAAGAFTFEGNFKVTAAFNGSEAPPLLRLHDNFGAEVVRVSKTGLGNNLAVRFGSSDTVSDIGFTPAADGFAHVAITLSSGTLRVFAEGTQLRSFTYGSFGTGAWSAYVGGAPAGTGSNALTCYMDEVRFTSGVNRYPGAGPFTPPTAPFPDF